MDLENIIENISRGLNIDGEDSAVAPEGWRGLWRDQVPASDSDRHLGQTPVFKEQTENGAICSVRPRRGIPIQTL